MQADVRLEDCMDLKDSVGLVPLLAQAHDEVLRISPEQGLPLPRQTGSTHRLDGVVIEVTVAILEREGIRIRAVRAVFAEGAPAFGVCGRGTGSARRWSWAQKAGRCDIDVANQVSVADGELDVESLAEKRAREGGRSLGEHGHVRRESVCLRAQESQPSPR